MQQAISIVPKLRAKIQALIRVPKNQSDFKKQASGYCHTYYSSENIDYGLLSQYPTDVELSDAYVMAAQENECLWSLLGIHPARIQGAPVRGLAAVPLPYPGFEHLYLQEENDLAPVADKTPAEELQEMIDSVKTTANFSRAADEQLDACVMALVALSMDELARVEDMPESNPERFAEIQRDIARALATQPAAFITLLQNMADSAVKNTPARLGVSETPPPVLLVDVSPDNLTPFIAAIIGQDQERGSSTGLNRKVRWTEQPESTGGGNLKAGTVIAKLKTGNAANAELAASGCSKEAIKRRRTILGGLRCVSMVAEAGIGAEDARRLENGCYGFAMIGSEIVLVHATTDSIGSLSFIVAQVYEHEFRRRFSTIHQADALLGTIRFAHLPVGSFLVLLPKDEAIKSFHTQMEIDIRAHKIFDE
ncbi:hypothetical protein B0H14DRAFT_2590625 [Mycena olivaceomarginata]|nr:hypothetical protein B0H14DRAFT_2590625 [Mycena olivaceomarginata]